MLTESITPSYPSQNLKQSRLDNWAIPSCSTALPVKPVGPKYNEPLKMSLKGCESGALVQTKSKGASSSFKVAKVEKPAAVMPVEPTFPANSEPWHSSVKELLDEYGHPSSNMINPEEIEDREFELELETSCGALSDITLLK